MKSFKLLKNLLSRQAGQPIQSYSLMQCHKALLLSMIHIVLCWGCRGSEQDVAQLGDARPQAITYLSSELIAISDAAYQSGRWGEGRIILINRTTGKREGVWYTPVSNPQDLSLIDDQLMVLSSGALSLGMSPKGDLSALSLLSVTEPLKTIRHFKWYAEPIGSYAVNAQPVDHQNETTFHVDLSSGIDGVLWRAVIPKVEETIDQEADVSQLLGVRYAPEGSLSLGALQRWNSFTVLVDFNTDRLHLFDEQGIQMPCSPELGRFEGVMEGAQTPFIQGNRLWVSFGLSGRLQHIDLDTLDLEDPNCRPIQEEYTPPLGQVPNDLLVIEDRILVLHSAESAIWVYDQMTGQRIAQWSLPSQTNPWHMAISPDGSELAVTEWVRGGITIINADTGDQIQQLSPSISAAPPPPSCAQPTDGPIKTGAMIIDRPITLTWPTSENGNEATATDLQAVPQLALWFDRINPAITIEVKLSPEDAWRQLALPPTLTVSSPKPQQGSDPLGLISLDDALPDPYPTQPPPDGYDPCDLFYPQPGLLNLTLDQLVNVDPTQRYWGGAHPLAGKVSLHQLRLSPSPTSELDELPTLYAATYRWWGQPATSVITVTSE